MNFRYFCQAVLVASLCCSCGQKTDDVGSGSNKGAAPPNGVGVSNALSNASSPQLSTGAISPATNSVSEEATKEVQRLTLQVTGKDISSGKTVTDAEGNPVTSTLPDGSRVFFQSSRPVALLAPTGMRTVYEYDPEGRLRVIVHPDGRREFLP